jgi:hypothetical protein
MYLILEVKIGWIFFLLCVLHCKEIWIYVFPEKELRGLSPNFYIYVSVSDLCSVHLFSCSKIGRPFRGIYKLFTET